MPDWSHALSRIKTAASPALRAGGRPPSGTRAGDLVKALLLANLDDNLIKRLDSLDRTNLNEFGVDPFGFNPDSVKYVAGPLWWLYKHYFRVEVAGAHHVPLHGRVMLVANHGGQLPFDAAMTVMATLVEPPAPRMARAMVERWTTELPWISTLYSRCGQIVGVPESCRRLLMAEECVLVFPEGVRGINKLWSQRYQLQEFGLGFMRLALQTGTPIIPVAVVGHEEQAPALYNFKSAARLLGMPALPITPTVLPLPLPSRYYIRFGEPLRFSGDPDDEDEVIDQKVAAVRQVLKDMIALGRKQRGNRIYW